MPTQDEIIYNTEVIFEENRKQLSILKQNSNSNCLIILENILFEAIVLFYTHRTVWTHPTFWQHYADSEDPYRFAKSAYNQMINSTLISIYNHLYFGIEGAFAQHLSTHAYYGNIITLYEKISPVIDNYEEVKNGLEVLRCVRNSFHGNNGNYIFTYPDVIIEFKGMLYKFYKDKPISLSYKFLSDFIPCLVAVYKFLFCHI